MTETTKDETEGTGGPSVLSAGLGREGFYEKMWKDFVSLQRGDAQLLCKDAARYRWLKERSLGPHADLCVTVNIGHDWSRVGEIDELDAELGRRGGGQ